MLREKIVPVSAIILDVIEGHIASATGTLINEVGLDQLRTDRQLCEAVNRPAAWFNGGAIQQQGFI
jgi:hypothetical protein